MTTGNERLEVYLPTGRKLDYGNSIYSWNIHGVNEIIVFRKNTMEFEARYVGIPFAIFNMEED